MMRPLSWPRPIARKLVPRRDVRDCCYYHRLDWYAIAKTVLAIAGQVNLAGLNTDAMADRSHELLQDARLIDEERAVAGMLLAEDCGIEVWRQDGQRRWTYQNGPAL